MSKYVRVTYTYLVPMPDDLPDDDPTMESTMIAGVSMMERHMNKLFQDPRRCVDLHSTWSLISEAERQAVQAQLGLGIEKVDPNLTRGKVPTRVPTRGQLPRNESEFDRITALQAIEGDFDSGVSFAQDIMGQREAKVPHPWDVGLHIFPEGHPLRAIEDEARLKYNSLPGDPEMQELIKQEMKGLEKGGDDEVS